MWDCTIFHEGNNLGLNMPQSLGKIFIHIVFSTKNRARIIPDTLRDELHAYFGGIVESCNGKLLKVGSVGDHVHLLVLLSRTCTISDLVRHLKIGSSKWMKEKRPELNGFHWQDGYGAFSISPSHYASLCRYIANQPEHHRRVSFQDEYRRLLEKYGVEYDEKYVWD
jgi:putative transposase